MKAKYTPMTFSIDGIVRDVDGRPFGRAVLPTWFKYSPGEDIKVVILKVPYRSSGSVLGETIFVDGFCYKIPEKIKEFRVNKRDKDWILSSFVLTRVVN